METSLTTTGKITQKVSQVLPTSYHLPKCQYYGCVKIGSENHYTLYFDSKEEAELELRCLEKRLSFETIETMEGEGYYPERAIIMEQKYEKSGRTNGLYTGLIAENGTVPKHSS
jgi:hypothetical protein